MFIEKLDLFGFKSFAQKTEIRLSRGFTGIVGPNGCGKSNICDAFRWVLGEQNIRQIRGDSLVDVIFNGTRDVRPLGMAEVTLTVNNAAGRLPTEYEHVAIRRRVFRSGDSQFFVNKNACRLKDIKSLFLDTGLGSFAYSVIHREMVDAVLSEKDDARRHLFEEAAGITRYKVRRREALLRLEGTERNLTRLQDILDVEERELRSLARQVGKTRRYQKLRNLIRSLDLLNAHRRWSELSLSETGTGDAHGEEARRRLRLESEVSQKEAALEALQVELLDTDRTVSDKQTELDTLQEEIRESSDRVLVLRERGESLAERIGSLGVRLDEETKRLEAVSSRRGEIEPRCTELETAWKSQEDQALAAETELAEIDKKLRGAKNELAGAQQLGLEAMEREAHLRSLWTQALERRQGLRAGIEDHEAKRSALGERFTALSEERDAQAAEHRRVSSEADEARARFDAVAKRRAELDRIRRDAAERKAKLLEKRAAAESRLHLLQEQRRTHEGHLTGVKKLLDSRSSLPGVHGPLGDLITVSSRWAATLGLALGDMVSWIVVDDLKAATRAARWLENEGQGSVTFLPLDSVGRTAAPAPGRGGLPDDALDGPKRLAPVVEFLKSRLRFAAGDDGVPSADQRDPGEIWMSGSGRVFGGTGWLRAAGSSIPSEEILRRGPAIEELEATLAGLDRERSAVAVVDATAAEESEKVDAEIAELSERLEDLDRRRNVSERRQSERDLELRILADERDRLATEEEKLRDGLAETEADLEMLTIRRDLHTSRERRTETQMGELSGRVSELEEEREQEQARVSSLRLEALRREGAVREVTSEVERLRGEEERLRLLIQNLESDRESNVQEKEAAARELEERTGSMEGLVRRREALHGSLEGRRGERNRKQDELLALEKSVRTLRSDLTKTQDALRDREVHLAQLRGEKEQVRQGILHEYQIDLTDGVPDPTPWSEEEAGLEPEEVGERLRDLKMKMDQLGPVNLLAVSDYDEKKERVTFLRSQKKDLESAKESLLEAIETINKKARELFLETFRQVQEHFQGTFQSLFPGGEARLELADDDPLEAVIDVKARPRGKRLESIRLLSTGERALTATALLFSLYLVKPSPFCILDELDAPLDDANTERFVGMLRHFSDRTQFVVITHNKITMEAADVLYGITMEQPGISKVVSVRLREAQEMAEVGAAAASQTADSGS